MDILNRHADHSTFIRVIANTVNTACGEPILGSCIGKDLHVLLLSLMLLFMGYQPTLAQYHIEGQILDVVSGAAVPGATVLIEQTTHGTAADLDGWFRLTLEPGMHNVYVSAVGYTAHAFMVDQSTASPLIIHLEPRIISMDGVMVEAQGSLTPDLSGPQQKLNATEDLVQRIAGVDLIQRANFAWEPTIRGLNAGQVGLVIDGMKIYGACVDRMDPASSYIEVENLERLEVTKGGFDLTQASQIGGTVNLITEKPDFNSPYDFSAETGYESVANLRRVHMDGGATFGDFSVRASFSYKQADDFSPGGQNALPHSGFEKRNYKFSLARRFGISHTTTATFLGDDAWFVGYPVLLMDATLAQARLGSLAHTWVPETPGFMEKVEGRAYYNHVDHWMDDRFRDVMQRPVMRGMYMPMYGYTDTWGGLSRIHTSFGQNRLGLTLDAHRVKQFGDMWMFSLFEGIPDMYLLNLGDVTALNTAATLDFSRPLGHKLNIRTNTRLDWSTRDILHEDAASVFRGRWGLEDLRKDYTLLSSSTTLTYRMQQTTLLRIGLASVARLPSNVENFGNYVYNYVDGYFYTGNPNLKPERSHQAELGLEYTGRHLAVQATAYFNEIRNYIYGTNDAGIGEALGGRASTYRFRVYTNALSAFLTGGEVSALWHIRGGLEVTSTLSYTYGHNRTLDEPLPMIPPLRGVLTLRYGHSKYWAELESRWANAQNRAAEQSAVEDRTDGYNILNLRTGYHLTSYADLKVGLENIFDTFYNEHLSIGNLPARGRNAYINLVFNF